MVNFSRLENDIRTRYEPVGRLPCPSLQHRRFAARELRGREPKYLLSCAAYATPIAPALLERQRQAAGVMSEPSHPCLSRVTDSHLDSGFHWLVAGLPASPNLLDSLRQQRLKRFEQVKGVLASVAEALRFAVARGWPRFTLEPHQIHVDFANAGVTLLIPDLPLFGVGAAEEEDSMMTRGVVPGFQAHNLVPIPEQDREYVAPLAALCCQMLGEDVSTGAGQNERFRALVALSAQQNHLLRSALGGTRRHDFESLGDFFQALTGGRSGTTTQGTHRHGETANAYAHAAPPPLPPEPLEPGQGGGGASSPPSRLAVPAVFANQPAQNVLRLRLIPNDKGQPLLGIVAAAQLTLGRATARDFVTQFRPRNPMNDSRTLAISRLQCEAVLDEAEIILRDAGSGNLSTRNGVPLAGGASLVPPFSVSVAGEYPVEFLPLPTAFPDAPPVVSGWPAEDGAPARRGACLLRPQDPQALPMEVAWVFTDAAIVSKPSDGVTFGSGGGAEVLARCHAHAGQIWLECVQRDKIILDKEPLQPGDVAPLRPGMSLLLGMWGFEVAACEEA